MIETLRTSGNQRTKILLILLALITPLAVPLSVAGSALPKEQSPEQIEPPPTWFTHNPRDQGASSAQMLEKNWPAEVDIRSLTPETEPIEVQPWRHSLAQLPPNQMHTTAAQTPSGRNDADYPPGPPPKLFPGQPKAVGDIQSNFNGIDYTGWIPPQISMAVGASHVMEATNSHFSVFQKNGVPVSGPVSYETFFDPALPVGWQGYLFSPKVVYHVNSNQFLTLILGRDDVNQTSFFFVGVSQTGNPSGVWWIWRIVANDTGTAGGDVDSWAGTAELGIDDWGLYIATDLFLWAGGFKYSTVHSFSTAMLNGGAASSWRFWNLQWSNGNLAYSLVPAHPQSIAGGAETFFVNTYSASGNAINLWKMTGDRTNSPTLVNSTIGVSNYYAIDENIDQPGSATDIDGGDARIRNAIYANRRVWTTLTTDVFNDGTRSGMFVAKLNVDAGTVVSQTIYHSTDVYYFYPAIVAGGSSSDANVAVYVNWTQPSSNQYASAAVLALMPDLQTSFSFLNVKSGEGPYVNLGSNGGNLWGYSSAGWDWSNNTAWGAVEWAKSNNQWNTQITEIELLGPTPADLDLQLIDATDGTYFPGDSIDIHNLTMNLGGTISTAYTITFYASTDTAVTELDISLGFVNRLGLNPGAADNFITTAALPTNLPSGNYYIGAILTVTDANSSNNVNLDPLPIAVITAPADLSLQLIDAEDGAFLPGTLISVLTIIQNIGDTMSDAFSISYYASDDQLISTADQFLGSLARPALNPAEIDGFNLIDLPLPGNLANGEYFVGAILDISDADASNNVNHDANPVSISTHPDIALRPLSLDFVEQNAGLREAKIEAVMTPSEYTQKVLPGLMTKALERGKVDLIVGLNAPFQPKGGLSRQQERNQVRAIRSTGDLLIADLQRTNARIKTQYRFIPYLALSADSAALKFLARSPLVANIAEDSVAKVYLASSNAVIGSPLAWTEGYDGEGWAVAVLDTGVDKAHSWFTSGGSKVVSEGCYGTNVAGEVESFCPGGASSSIAMDSGLPCPIAGCDHGTHVAGIVGGNDGNGPDYGVARGADIIAIQVFSRFLDELDCGSGQAPCIASRTSDQIAALERVLTLSNSLNIAAVNMSLGGGQFFGRPACNAANLGTKAAIDNLRSVGIATVIAAGNDGWVDSIGAPACISTAISVGATTDRDAVAGFSNIYSAIQLLAPGVDINSSEPAEMIGSKQGTSMATPHVAGAWAVMKQRIPTASVSKILTIFWDTATVVDDSRVGGTVTNMKRINLDLALGEPRTTFGIFNGGPASLSVTSIVPDAFAPWITWSPMAPFDVPAGQLQVVGVEIDFDIAPVGISTTRLMVHSNDPDDSPFPGGVMINVMTVDVIFANSFEAQ